MELFLKPMTVMELFLELQDMIKRDPAVAVFEVWSADDCSSSCDTPASDIFLDPVKCRLIVGG